MPVTAPAPVVERALARYRVMAFIVGVMLLLLVAAMLAKYVFGIIESTAIVAIGHGWLYMVYVIVSLDLVFRMRWGVGRIAFVVISGTVPFLSFWCEHKVTGWVRAELAAAAAAAPSATLAAGD